MSKATEPVLKLELYGDTVTTETEFLDSLFSIADIFRMAAQGVYPPGPETDTMIAETRQHLDAIMERWEALKRQDDAMDVEFEDE